MTEASFYLSSKDYVAYCRRLCARSLAPIVASSVLIVSALSLAVDGIHGVEPAIFGTAAGLAIFAVYVFLIVPRSAQAIYSEQASISETRTLAIDAHGIEFGQLSGTFRSHWTDIVKWDETPRLLTLFINRAMFIPITKSDIGPETSRLIKQHLVDSGLKKPRRGRTRR